MAACCIMRDTYEPANACSCLLHQHACCDVVGCIVVGRVLSLGSFSSLVRFLQLFGCRDLASCLCTAVADLQAFVGAWSAEMMMNCSTRLLLLAGTLQHNRHADFCEDTDWQDHHP